MASNDRTERDLQAALAALRRGRPQPASSIRVDELLNQLWDDLDSDNITRTLFLKLACNFFEPDPVIIDHTLPF
jgi:hypothetical protein